MAADTGRMSSGRRLMQVETWCKDDAANRRGLRRFDTSRRSRKMGGDSADAAPTPIRAAAYRRRACTRSSRRYASPRRSLLVGLLGDHLVLDLLVGRVRDDLAGEQLVLLGVG